MLTPLLPVLDGWLASLMPGGDLCNKVNQEKPQAGAAAFESVFRDEKMLLIFNYIQ